MGYVACKEKLSFKPQDGNLWQNGSVENVSGGRWRCTTCGLHTAKANVTHTHTLRHTEPLLFIPCLPAYVQSHMQSPDSAQPFPHTCHSHKNWMTGSSAVFLWWKYKCLFFWSIQWNSRLLMLMCKERKISKKPIPLYLLSNCFPCFLTMPKCSQSANTIQSNVTVKFGVTW